MSYLIYRFSPAPLGLARPRASRFVGLAYLVGESRRGGPGPWPWPLKARSDLLFRPIGIPFLHGKKAAGRQTRAANPRPTGRKRREPGRRCDQPSPEPGARPGPARGTGAKRYPARSVRVEGC